MMFQDDDTVLVYSTDPADNRKCPQCKRLLPECTCAHNPAEPAGSMTVVLRIEKSGRQGKTVTVIDRLPRNENYLKDLAKKLKTKCGCGGTYMLKNDGGLIEIQGDQREILPPLLAREGIRCKG